MSRTGSPFQDEYIQKEKGKIAVILVLNCLTVTQHNEFKVLNH
jgi:hypothetical protein